jgi:hypothetical protein
MGQLLQGKVVGGTPAIEPVWRSERRGLSPNQLEKDFSDVKRYNDYNVIGEKRDRSTTENTNGIFHGPSAYYVNPADRKYNESRDYVRPENDAHLRAIPPVRPATEHNKPWSFEAAMNGMSYHGRTGNAGLSPPADGFAGTNKGTIPPSAAVTPEQLQRAQMLGMKDMYVGTDLPRSSGNMGWADKRLNQAINPMNGGLSYLQQTADPETEMMAEWIRQPSQETADRINEWRQRIYGNGPQKSTLNPINQNWDRAMPRPPWERVPRRMKETS